MGMRPATSSTITTSHSGQKPPMASASPRSGSGTPHGAGPGSASPRLPMGSGVGQKLRSSLSNRMDDVLTSRSSGSREPSPGRSARGFGDVDFTRTAPSPLRTSRDPSPERSASADLVMPQIDLDNPERTRRLLKAHSEALRLRLQTVSADRDNLRFQVRMQRRDAPDARLVGLRDKISALELENKNLPAMEIENQELLGRVKELEAELGKASGGASSASGTSGNDADFLSENPEVLSELKWENHLLKKRLNRTTKYVEQLRREYYSTRMEKASEARERRRPLTADVATLATDMQRQGMSDPAEPLSPVRLDGNSASSAGGKGDDRYRGLDGELKKLLQDNEEYLERLRCDVVRVATAAAQRAQTAMPGYGPADGMAGSSLQNSLSPKGNAEKRSKAVDVLVLGDDGGATDEWHKSGMSP
eukprot:gnl/MRDRNA2_/MRDRNA2_104122_c0_seq1.p1 gnl/MRDRNA2_/MRDRNA2_104122_c0~~gnl/MRDRNA2_/MRDRNA2_104122_c0_seq1.p1  ORF type:complete len:420 (-),score=84.93 gnl/MRDRNA2_/MRDRNA2_104122_c0_seq1:70-1329(-)